MEIFKNNAILLLKHYLSYIGRWGPRQYLFILFCVFYLSVPALFKESPVKDSLCWINFVGAASRAVIIAYILAIIRDILKRKIFTYVCLLLLALFAFIDIWLNFTLYSRPSLEMLILANGTTKTECIEFLKLYVFNFTTLIFFVLMLASVWAFPSIERALQRKTIIFNMGTGMITVSIFCLSLCCVAIFKYREYGYPHAKDTLSMWYAVFCEALLDKSDEVDEFLETHRNINIENCEFKSPHIVLIIGESHSKLHTDLYGYTLSTMPLLSKELENGNLIVFDSVYTVNTVTHRVLKSLFSTAEDIDEFSHSPLFPAVMKKAGYDVSFFSNAFAQFDKKNMWDYNEQYYLNLIQINDASFDYRNPQVYMDDLEMIEASVKLINDSISFTCVIYQFVGQHADAKNRFRASRRIFGPEDYKYRTDLNPRQIVDVSNYDNATREVDHSINMIIDQYREKDAIVIYVSDHGEEVHDFRNQYGRTFENESSPHFKNYYKCVYEVPMFVWLSESYKENHGELVKWITERKSIPMENSHISQFILDLAGIEYSKK